MAALCAGPGTSTLSCTMSRWVPLLPTLLNPFANAEGQLALAHMCAPVIHCLLLVVWLKSWQLAQLGHVSCNLRALGLPGAAILCPNSVAEPARVQQPVSGEIRHYVSSGRPVYNILSMLVLCSQSANSLAHWCLTFRVWLPLTALARHIFLISPVNRWLGRGQDSYWVLWLAGVYLLSHVHTTA